MGSRKEAILSKLEMIMEPSTRIIIVACVLAVLAAVAGCATQESARQVQFEAMVQAIEDMEAAMQDLLEVQEEARRNE